jgi:hypothetical protein
MSFLKHGYVEPPENTFELLPEGDYKFTVLETSTIEEQDNGHEKLSLVLSVNDQKVWCFLYEGISSKGKHFDMISPFLKTIGQAPTATQAASPKYWASLVGKKGMCHIVQETQVGGKYAGRLQNKVSHFIYADNIRLTKTATQPPAQHAPAGAPDPTLGHDPDLDIVPDDIPF